MIPPKMWNSINGRGTTLCKLSTKLQAETAIFRALHPHAIVGCRLLQAGLLRLAEVDPVHIPVFLSPQSTVRWSATFAGELADIFHHRPQRQYRIQALARNSSLTPQQHFLQSFQHHSPDSPFKAVVDQTNTRTREINGNRQNLHMHHQPHKGRFCVTLSRQNQDTIGAGLLGQDVKVIGSSKYAVPLSNYNVDNLIPPLNGYTEKSCIF